MKKFFLAAALVAAACSCSDKTAFTINGKAGELDGKAVLSYKTLSDELAADTVAMKGGSFVFKGTVEEPLLANIQLLPEGSDPVVMSGVFVIEPVEISVSMDPADIVDNGSRGGLCCKPVVVGGRNNAFISGLDGVTEEVAASSSDFAEYAKDFKALEKMGYADFDAYRAKYDEMMEKYSEVMPAYNDAVYQAIQKYVEQHKDCEVATMWFNAYFSDLPFDEYVGKFESFPESVRNSFIARQIKEDIEARKATQPGCEAPDFTLKTPDGSELTLSSLRGGKVIMLDFWGSWCGWCIKGIPTLKEKYAAYSDKIEFISIDCRDTQEKWLKAIEDNELPWLQVKSEEEDDTPGKYGVQGYPSFYFIDQDGKILKVFLGESEEFENYFSELFD